MSNKQTNDLSVFNRRDPEVRRIGEEKRSATFRNPAKPEFLRDSGQQRLVGHTEKSYLNTVTLHPWLLLMGWQPA